MRDARGRSRPPRLLASAIRDFRHDGSPGTPLAAVISVWDSSVGDRIAAVARPDSEHDGVVTVICDSGVWAQELSLMEPRIRAKILESAPGSALRELRFKTG